MAHYLVTGGTGYIGSHTVIELLNTGDNITIIDNLYNSDVEVLNRIERICGRRPAFVEADIRDGGALDRLFACGDIAAVIHFAGLKAVGESVEKPIEYYDNNVYGTLSLLHAMRRADVKRLVFSSSATVYGTPQSVPIREDFPLSATNPYGQSKLMVEHILRDLAISDPSWKIAILRYFNPVGAHASGLVGEAPNGIPNNLLPYVSQVAVGKREFLSVFGDDYPTRDGTGVRDYIHVVDLARGHLAALRALDAAREALIVNLGTGNGYSVLEMVRAFEQACGRPVPFRVTPRRPGDIAECFADPSHAQAVLGWKAEHDLAAMCRDAWNWQRNNPDGYVRA